MPNKPETWDLQRLSSEQLGNTAVLTTRSVAETVAAVLPYPQVEGLDALSDGLQTLIVVGGGTLMDVAKVWRARNASATRLIAIPSVWGSGAEVSPVAVLNRDGHKEIHVGDEYLPDARSVWPTLAANLPESVARHGCGDAWSHALEGFLSPLADEALQHELAEVIDDMLALPLGNDARWFEPSARACAGQARSGVGLVHGIAHTLEGPLREASPDAGWGHAKLCSVFLWPVMEFNRRHSSKWERLSGQHALDSDEVFGVLRRLYEAEAYAEALPLLQQHWKAILRDPCSRTNSALVRPGSKDFFVESAFR